MVYNGVLQQIQNVVRVGEDIQEPSTLNLDFLGTVIIFLQMSHDSAFPFNSQNVGSSWRGKKNKNKQTKPQANAGENENIVMWIHQVIFWK